MPVVTDRKHFFSSSELSFSLALLLLDHTKLNFIGAVVSKENSWDLVGGKYPLSNGELDMHRIIPMCTHTPKIVPIQKRLLIF